MTADDPTGLLLQTGSESPEAEPSASTAAAAAIDCEQITVESAFVVDPPVRSLVLVRFVCVDQSLRAARRHPLVKFSHPDHAPDCAPSLLLATAGFYRQRGEDDAGLGDTLEASYVADLADYLAKNHTTLPASAGLVTGTVTSRADGSWMFCTSLRPESSAGIERMRRRFDKRAATRIDTPSEFACAWGRAVAQMAALPTTERDVLAVIQHAQLSAAGFERMVRVDHGPVAYPADPKRLTESVPQLHHAAAVPFIKRPTYSWQHEYRFTVSTNGKPSQDQLRVPIRPRLCSLTTIVV